MSVARYNNRFLPVAQPGGGGGGEPADPEGSVQFNDAGAFGGDASYTFDGTNVTTTNAYFADGGIDTSGAGALALAQVNATSVTIGQAANPVSAAITIPNNVAAPWTIVDENGDTYMEIRTAPTRYVAFGDNNVPPNYFFQGTSITMVVGADASGQVEAASFGPGGLSFFNRPMFVGTDVQATAITIGHDAADLTIDSQDVIVSEAPLTLGALGGDPGAVALSGRLYTKTPGGTELFYQDAAGNVVQLTSGGSVPAGTAVVIPDDTVDAYTITEGANPYLRIDTTNGDEQLDWSESGGQGIAHRFWLKPNKTDAFQIANAVAGAGKFIQCDTATNNERLSLGEFAGGLTGGPRTIRMIARSPNSSALSMWNSSFRLFFNADNTAAMTLTYGNTTDNYDFAFRGTGELRLGDTGATIGILGAAPVARTAAYTVTNPNDRRSFNTQLIPVDDLAEVVGTLIADLQLLGYFG